MRVQHRTYTAHSVKLGKSKKILQDHALQRSRGELTLCCRGLLTPTTRRTALYSTNFGQHWPRQKLYTTPQPNSAVCVSQACKTQRQSDFVDVFPHSSSKMPSKKVVIRLSHELNIYIDSVLVDKRFANLYTISKLDRLKVYTKKHIAFCLVNRLLKLVLVLFCRHCVGGEMLFCNKSLWRKYREIILALNSWMIYHMLCETRISSHNSNWQFSIWFHKTEDHI